jgi:hypothetical protein
LLHCNRHHRQARLPDQRHLPENFVGFDCREFDRFGQGFFRRKINRRPVVLVRRWIGIGFLGDAREANDGFFPAAVVKENSIAGFHRAKVFSRRIISHARPCRFAVLQKVGPRISLRFGFHQPIIHDEN